MEPSTLKKRLELLGWQDVGPRSHFGEEFDLVGSRQFSFLAKWNVLVKYVDVLDDEEAHRWAQRFQHINEESKNPTDERCFLLCLIAEKVETDPKSLINARDSFGLESVFRKSFDDPSCRGGGGIIFVVDLPARTIHGTVPFLPYDVRTYSRELQALFDDL